MVGSGELKERMPQETTLQMINFMVGGEEYAVDIQKVREVIYMREITPLPRTLPFVKGIINLRGEVIPVIDLREKFGLDHDAYTSQTNVIIVETSGKCMGVVVDRVSHVIRLSSGELAPPPPLIGGLSGAYVLGVGKLQDRFVVVLDIEKILTTAEMIELVKMAETAPAGPAAPETSRESPQ